MENKNHFFLQKVMLFVILLLFFSYTLPNEAKAQLQPKFGTFISFDNAKYPFDFGGVSRTDSQGNTYIFGRVCTSVNTMVDPNDPLSLAFFCGKNDANANLGDAYVAKFNSSGGLVYKTLLAGSKDDGAGDMVIDGSGNVYVTGPTRSIDFANGTPLATKPQPKDTYGYLTKLKPDGSIDFTAYISQGTTGKDFPTTLSLGKDGNIYLAGFTDSNDFLGMTPQGTPLQKTYNGGRDGFILKLDKAGKILAGTFFGGSNGGNVTSDLIDSIALDASGNVLVSGTTDADNFSIFPAITPIKIGGKAGSPKINSNDAFLLKIDNNLSKAISFAYLGGSGLEIGSDFKIDSKNNIYLTGISSSADLFDSLTPAPVIQNTLLGGADAYVLKLDENFKYLNGTYLGGTQGETGSSILIDNNENIYIAGVTLSLDFPIKGTPVQNTFKGISDNFVTKIKSDFSTIVYSTYLGGDGSDSGSSITGDPTGTLYITGNSNNGTNFPITAGAFQTNFLGNNDMFLVALTGIGEPFPSSEEGNKQDKGAPIPADNNGGGGGGCSILSTHLAFHFNLINLLGFIPMIYLRLKPVAVRRRVRK